MGSDWIEPARRLHGRSGDGSATWFADWVARSYGELHRLLRLRLRRRFQRSVECEDHLHAAIVIAIRKRITLEACSERRAAAWILGTAEREAANQFRSLLRHRATELHEADVLRIQAQGRGPEERAIRAESRGNLLACCDRLSPAHRKVIWIRDFEGHSWSRTTALCGKSSVHATQELHRRALISLRIMVRATHGPH